VFGHVAERVPDLASRASCDPQAAMSIGQTEVCAYCATALLTGSERPEHPIPAAIGASLEVRTVCDACNEWAGINVDQPFLADDQVRIYRAEHDIRDPRRRNSRPVPHPFHHGTTDDGRRVTVDAAGRPRMQSGIFERPDGSYRITASSQDEADRLVARLEARLAREGFRPVVTNSTTRKFRPRINLAVTMDLHVWTRLIAKAALSIASHIYEPEWRASEDAGRLREVMRNGETSDGDYLVPDFIADGHVFREMADPPDHLAYFTSHERTTKLVFSLFGHVGMGVPVDTTGRSVPRVAWHFDPLSVTKDPETTFDGLVERAVRRRVARDDQ
jgi:hypothetical protein